MIGGPASNVPYLSSELAKKGIQVFVVTQGFPRYKSRTRENGFQVYRVPVLHHTNYYNPLTAILRAVAMGFMAGILSLRNNVDVIHAHDMNISGIAGLIAKILSGKKCVMKYSGDLVWEYISLTDWDPLRTLEDLWKSTKREAVILRTIERILLKAYDFIIAPSLYQEEMLKRIGTDRRKIVVIPNAINYDLFSRAFPLQKDGKVLPRSKIVMTAGRLVPWKGLDSLVYAAKIVKQHREDVGFVVLGDGPEGVRLRKMVKELGVEKNFHFLGRKNHGEMPRYLASADVFVLPTLYEPAPHVVLEALACGGVVVATNTGGLREVIRNGKNGILIEKRNYSQLANAIIKILDDKTYAQRISTLARKTAKRYDWGNIADMFVSLYRSIK